MYSKLHNTYLLILYSRTAHANNNQHIYYIGCQYNFVKVLSFCNYNIVKLHILTKSIT